jgi:hypothetical protein
MVWDKEARDFVQVTEVNEDGEEVGMYEFDSQGAIRAIENINKMMGYNELEKDEGDGPAPTTNILIVNKLYDHQASNRSDEKTD